MKHNPFAYFQSVQEGPILITASKNVVGLMARTVCTPTLPPATLRTSRLSLRTSATTSTDAATRTAFCNFDPTDNGTQAGLNPALIQLGDVAVQKIVTAIHRSPAWKFGHNAIVIVWDENDYSTAPNVNQVATIVETNYGVHGVQSARRYTHFSLLKSLEAGLWLRCLNHACDANVALMTDLFAVGVSPLSP